MAFKSYEDTGHYHKQRPGRDHERFFIGQNPQDHDAHKGYLILLRFNMNSLAEVRDGFARNTTPLKVHGGTIIGIAAPDNIRVIEADGGSVALRTWNRSYKNAAVLLFFSKVSHAEQFFRTATRIKDTDWPDSDHYEAIATPLNYPMNALSINNNMLFDDSPIVILWTEFPGFQYEQIDSAKFVDYHSNPVKSAIRAVGGDPFISIAFYEPSGYDPSPRLHHGGTVPRVARPIKHAWLGQKAMVTVSVFRSMADYMRFRGDVTNAINYRNNVTKATDVVLELERIKPQLAGKQLTMAPNGRPADYQRYQEHHSPRGYPPEPYGHPDYHSPRGHAPGPRVYPEEHHSPRGHQPDPYGHPDYHSPRGHQAGPRGYPEEHHSPRGHHPGTNAYPDEHHSPRGHYPNGPEMPPERPTFQRYQRHHERLYEAPVEPYREHGQRNYDHMYDVQRR